MTFRDQHQSLMNFFGVLRLFTPKMSMTEKLALCEKYWAPDDREAMLYWLSVALDRETLPFDPIPYSFKDGTSYLPDPVITPEELIENLDEGLTTEEALEVLEELRQHMFTAAYNPLRVILSRDLSAWNVDDCTAKALFKFLEESLCNASG